MLLCERRNHQSVSDLSKSHQLVRVRVSAAAHAKKGTFCSMAVHSDNNRIHGKTVLCQDHSYARRFHVVADTAPTSFFRLDFFGLTFFVNAVILAFITAMQEA